MNLRAFLVLFLLFVAVFPLTVVVSVDDTKHAAGNQVEDPRYELDQGRGGGLDHEDQSKYGAGAIGRTFQRGGGDTERGGGGGDSSRGGGGGDRESRGGRGDRERRGRRGRRGGRGGGV